jgi:NAD(P)-dependent dehydrogenase (short-subunit alcohol dehydrogenase family)
MQARGHIDLNSTPTTSISGPAAYAASKLANILFTKELQRRLEGSDAVANCFHPGIVRGQFGAFSADLGFWMGLAFKLSIPFSKTPEQGADTLVWLATSRRRRSSKENT